MPLHLDTDLVIFAFTVAAVLTRAVPRMRRNARVLQREQQFHDVAPEALTDAQQKLFAGYDAKLERLNYRPIVTYRVANVGDGHNLQRYYINPQETAHCVVMIVELAVKTSRGLTFAHSQSVRFSTKFTDGTTLTTRNNKLKSVMDNPPYRIVQACPGVTDVAELKRRHDKRAAGMGCPITPPATAEAVFKESQQDHQRFLEYQIQQGIYQPAADGSGYKLAGKAHWRGVWNHYNLLAQHFSALRLVSALLVGLGLPALLWLKIVPAINLAQPAIAPTATKFVAYACYAAAGAIIGYLLDRSTFLWAFVLTYIGAHVAVGWSMPGYAFSTVAGVVAHYAAQARKRAHLVILPQP